MKIELRKVENAASEFIKIPKWIEKTWHGTENLNPKEKQKEQQKLISVVKQGYRSGLSGRPPNDRNISNSMMKIFHKAYQDGFDQLVKLRKMDDDDWGPAKKNSGAAWRRWENEMTDAYIKKELGK